MQIDIVSLITIFILAVFVGNEIINKVPPTLHTPLMSGSNAISGIAIVGAILAILVDAGDASKYICLLYTSPSPRDATLSRMPSSA